MINPLGSGSMLQNGRYRVGTLRRLGGQSLVYDASDSKTGQPVIIKQTYLDAQWSHDALRHEADILADLQHKSIPRLIDCFTESQSTFLVLVRISGHDLAEIMEERQSPLEYELALNVVFQLLNILEYLQSREVVIVHRDIKPKNLMLTEDDDLFLLDFGISKRLGSETLFWGGTPHYAAPEQLKNESTDGRADIYGVAATMYYLLTGIEPPDSLSRESSILRDQGDPLLPIDHYRPAVPHFVSTVFMQALDLTREQRPSSALMLRQWLEVAIAGKERDEETEVQPAMRLKTPARARSLIVVPLDSVTPGDLTDAALELLRALATSDLKPDVIQLLIEVLDNNLDQRMGVLARRVDLVLPYDDRVSRLASNLIKSVASNLYIDPAVRVKLRLKLGEVLADHILSDRSLMRHSVDFARSEEPVQRQAGLRQLSIWALRGFLLGILCQLILAVFIGGNTALELAALDNAWVLGLLHVVVISFAAVLVRGATSVAQRDSQPGSDWQIVSLCLGFLLALVGVHDILRIISSS
jgi:serine/threonine protein kinase